MNVRAIDRASPIPCYYQLQEILKEEIDDGRWSPGTLLPSESQMEATFLISRTVIRKALDILEADGQVARIRGKGTMVLPEKVRYEVLMADRGRPKPGDPTSRMVRLLDTRRATAGGQVARLLHLSPEVEVLEITFVQSVDGTPASLSQMYLRIDASAHLADACRGGELPLLQPGGASAFEQLADRYGVLVGESTVELEATLVNDLEADVLKISPRSSAFLLTSLESNRAGDPIALVRTVVRGDHFRFSVLIKHRDTVDDWIAVSTEAPARLGPTTLNRLAS